MKTFKLAFVGLALAVVGCGGGGGGSAVTIPTTPVQITTANATTVANGAVNTSQGMVSTGTSQAGFVGVVAQNIGRNRSILDISLSEFNRARSLQFTPVVSGANASQTFPCSNSNGSITASIQDVDGSSSFSVGDILTLAFSNCFEPSSAGVNASTMNGSVTFVITNSNGPLAFGQATGTPQSPFTAAFTITFINFSITDNVTNLTESISGDINFSTSDNGTYTTGTMSGSSLRMDSSVDGAFLMTGYNFNFTDANIQTLSTPYSFSVTMSVASVVAKGSVTINTTTPFTGVGIGDPTAGAMLITGANGSTLNINALPDGIHVRLIVDDGAGPNLPVTITNPATQTDYTWAEL